MIQGIDSYVTLAEADDYVANFYAQISWSELSETQKEQRLVLACERLEALPFTGRKRLRGQNLLFPRWPSDTVPQAIKAAQIEIAVLDLRNDASAVVADAAKRAALQQQGVTAYTIGHLSESYGSGTGEFAEFPFMADGKVQSLLRPFLRGGHMTC